jgi:hypothetical protein
MVANRDSAPRALILVVAEAALGE